MYSHLLSSNEQIDDLVYDLIKKGVDRFYLIDAWITSKVCVGFKFRQLDRSLQRLRKKGMIKYNRVLQRWEINNGS